MKEVIKVLLMGAPGSGKGSLGLAISSSSVLTVVSTGYLLRSALNVAESTHSTNIAQETIKKGNLADDDKVYEILENELKRDVYKNGIILDGYPRTLKQAYTIDSHLDSNHIIIFLNADKEEIEKRITGRFMCSVCHSVYNAFYKLPAKGYLDIKTGSLTQEDLHSKSAQLECSCGSQNFYKRDDDELGILKNRLEQYNCSTLPVINYYRNYKYFIEIDGNRKLADIYPEALTYLKKYKIL